MTVPIPALPPQDNHDWYGHYSAIDAAVRELQTLVEALTPASGFIATINGEAPDGTGNLVLSATDVNAKDVSYTPTVTDLPLGIGTWVFKDTVTGFWPTGYNADGSPIYTSGSASAGVRPHARNTPVIWLGADPAPATVSSGTGGMLRGYDQRAIPTP
jgi:hypothetical protein